MNAAPHLLEVDGICKYYGNVVALKDITTAKKLTVNDSTWTAEKPFLLRQVRAELASATLGSLDRYRIAVEDDSQLNAALGLFPKAQALMAASTPEESQTSKKSGRR